MIDESALGTRDRKGAWVPDRRVGYGPLFAWPIRPGRIARWFVSYPGYLLPWNAVYLAIGLLVWFFATPSTETMTTFRPGWIALILLRNLAIVVAWYGLFHLRLYVRRAQDTRTKFNARWPREGSRFTFGDQTKENVFWTLASGVPIVTAYEVVTHWLFANGHITWLRWDDHPIWIVLIFLVIPIWREIHFYAIHRLIHVPALYKRVHSLHHRNTNPGPWSGLSMYPVEHLLYFSAIAIHWIVSSHPAHAMFTQFHLLLAPTPGHSGFEKIEVGNGAIETNGFGHYLHHKYFEVNYSDGVVPLDKWFGSFHDGSAEGLARFKARPGDATADGGD